MSISHFFCSVVEVERCKVCSEPAGKHIYYGGKVCTSCRAFFRRAVQNHYYEVFNCSKAKNCDINIQTRKGCQYCRFQKCLNAGMIISKVVIETSRNTVPNLNTPLQLDNQR